MIQESFTIYVTLDMASNKKIPNLTLKYYKTQTLWALGIFAPSVYKIQRGELCPHSCVHTLWKYLSVNI